eukprot:465058-Amphidinium_carterae.1
MPTTSDVLMKQEIEAKRSHVRRDNNHRGRSTQITWSCNPLQTSRNFWEPLLMQNCRIQSQPWEPRQCADIQRALS